MAFFSDLANLVAQVLLFYYIGKLVPPDSLPSYGGVHASYIEFVTLGIVVNVFVQVALTRIAGALRQEQLMGTLESLLVTPTAAATVQLGSAVFDLVYMPLRTRGLPRLHGGCSSASSWIRPGSPRRSCCCSPSSRASGESGSAARRASSRSSAEPAP